MLMYGPAIHPVAAMPSAPNSALSTPRSTCASAADENVGAEHRTRAEVEHAEVAVAGAEIGHRRLVVLHAALDPEIDEARLDLLARVRRGGDVGKADGEFDLLRASLLIERDVAAERVVGGRRRVGRCGRCGCDRARAR